MVVLFLLSFLLAAGNGAIFALLAIAVLSLVACAPANACASASTMALRRASRSPSWTVRVSACAVKGTSV